MYKQIKSSKYNIYNTTDIDDIIIDDKARIGVEVNKYIMSEYQFIFKDIINILNQTLSPNIVNSDHTILSINTNIINYIYPYPGIKNNYILCNFEGEIPHNILSTTPIFINMSIVDNYEKYTASFTYSVPRSVGAVYHRNLMVVDNLYDVIYKLNKSTFLPIESQSSLIETGFHNFESEFKPLDIALLTNEFNKDITEGLIDKNVDKLYVNKTYNDIGIVGGISIRYEDVAVIEGQWVKLGTTNDKLIPKFTQNIECTIVNGPPLVQDSLSKSNKAFVIWIGADTFVEDNTYLFENDTIRYEIDYSASGEIDNIYNVSKAHIDYIPESLASTIKMGDILIKLPDKTLSNYEITLLDKSKAFGVSNDPYLYIYINQYLKTSEYINYDNYIDSSLLSPDYIYQKFDLIKYNNEFFISKLGGNLNDLSTLIHVLESNPGYKPYVNTGVGAGNVDREIERTYININDTPIINGVINPLYEGDIVTFTKIGYYGGNQETQKITVTIKAELNIYDRAYIRNINGYDSDNLYENIGQTGNIILDTGSTDHDTSELMNGNLDYISISQGEFTVKQIIDGEYIRLRFYTDDTKLDNTVYFQLKYNPQLDIQIP